MNEPNLDGIEKIRGEHKEENSSENFLVRVGDKSIARYSNVLVRRGFEDITKVSTPIKEVKIGEQIWMAENLNVEHYRNGDPIPEVSDPNEWAKLTMGAWCYYDNDPENGKIYGKFYNWYAVNDPRGLAPEGWHIPTEAEFYKLQEAVSNDGNALKALGQGNDYDFGAGAGTNTSGFSALLLGLRFCDGDFFLLGYRGDFWTATELGTYEACLMYLFKGSNIISYSNSVKKCGLTIRCVKGEDCALQGTSDIHKTIELNPDDAEAYCNRGDTKYYFQDYGGAIQDYNKAIELNPNDALTYYSRGNAKGKLGDHRGAIQDYNKAIELNPNHAEAYYMRGHAKSDLEDYRGAIQDYNKAIELNPNDSYVYNNRGNVKGKLEDHRGAIQDYNKAIELDPNIGWVYGNRGNAKNELEDYGGAIQDCNKAIELNPNDANAYNNRGNAKHNLKDHKGSIQDCTKAIELDSNHAEAYYHRGLAKQDLGDNAGACLDWSKAGELGEVRAYELIKKYCS
ncbi:MAG: hypothetical protein C0417_10535 [Chlorobiaceae bacterium]|nr:hypothetical protein [Chlorobiaceae bacterium]